MDRFLPPDVTKAVTQAAVWADKLARSELVEGLLSSENEYTSIFVQNFRQQINARDIRGLRAESIVLPNRSEQYLGSDGAIVLSTDRSFKVGVFEAKWPRFTFNKYPWDYPQGQSEISHFNSQLNRQMNICADYLVWGMFYSEAPFGDDSLRFPKMGSACVIRDDLVRYRDTENIAVWNNETLGNLLSKKHTDIETIVSAMCTCSMGNQIPGSFHDIRLQRSIARDTLIVEYSGGARKIYTSPKLSESPETLWVANSLEPSKV